MGKVGTGARRPRSILGDRGAGGGHGVLGLMKRNQLNNAPIYIILYIGVRDLPFWDMLSLGAQRMRLECSGKKCVVVVAAAVVTLA